MRRSAVGKRDVNAIIKKVIYISSSVKISDLAARPEHHKLHMAVVVDEFVAREGIVTVEDIIEELVGRYLGGTRRGGR